MAYKKARKGKSRKTSIIEFEKNLEQNLRDLQNDLINLTYKPRPLKRFIIRDPKIRIIHASAFRDRVVHHVLINILEPIFEKIFIYDSYASRKNKGTHRAIERFDSFKKIISQNGLTIQKERVNKNQIQGYCLKADIKHYFDSVNHEILIFILMKKIRDGKIIWLTRKILNNFYTPVKDTGMPLGNFTSQFFANVYLNELDYFVKHKLKAKYYIRYVDDFLILHKNKKRLEYFKYEIDLFLQKLKLELHPDKSKIIPLQKGVTFLGYRIFYHYKLLKKKNKRYFLKKLEGKLELFKEGLLDEKLFLENLQGWFGYAIWANTYILRRKMIKQIEEIIDKSYK